MISNWADKPMKYFADKSGIPVADLSSELVGEATGVGLEQVTNLFTKGWFNLFMKVGTGVLANSYAIWGKPKDERTRKELIPMGNHLILRALDVDNVIELINSIGLTQAALKRGDTNAILASMVKSPQELQLVLNALGLTARPTSPKTPQRANSAIESDKYAAPGRIDIEARPPTGQARYQITA